MSNRNDAFWRRRDQYWRQVNAQHRDCEPSSCPNRVDHSRYRISEFQFAEQVAELDAELDAFAATGRMPRKPRPEPGE